VVESSWREMKATKSTGFLLRATVPLKLRTKKQPLKDGMLGR